MDSNPESLRGNSVQKLIPSLKDTFKRFIIVYKRIELVKDVVTEKIIFI